MSESDHRLLYRDAVVEVSNAFVTQMSDHFQSFYPVYTETSAVCFADHPAIPESTIMVRGLCFQTKPLKTSINIDLVGLTISESLTASGLINPTVALHPDVRLKAFYLHVEYHDVVARVEIGDKTPPHESTEERRWKQSLSFSSNNVNLPGRALFDFGGKDEFYRIKVDLLGDIDIASGQVLVVGQAKFIGGATDESDTKIHVIGYELDYRLEKVGDEVV